MICYLDLFGVCLLCQPSGVVDYWLVNHLCSCTSCRICCLETLCWWDMMGHGGTWWPWFVIGVSCGGHWCHSAGDSFRSYTRYHTVQFGMFLYYRCFVPTELENELGDHSQRDSMGILDVSSDPSCNISNELAARVSYLAGYPPPKPSGDVVLDQADANMAAYFSRDQLQNNWLATLCKT